MHHQQTITIINRKCHLAAHVPISKLVFIRKAHIQTHAHVYVHIYILSLPTSNIHAFMAFQQSKSRETSKYRKKNNKSISIWQPANKCNTVHCFVHYVFTAIHAANVIFRNKLKTISDEWHLNEKHYQN